MEVTYSLWNHRYTIVLEQCSILAKDIKESLERMASLEQLQLPIYICIDHIAYSVFNYSSFLEAKQIPT